MLTRTENLFLPYREPNYPLTDIVHFFAKRLQISPTETMMMDPDKRDKIFKIEKKILDDEIENAKKKPR